MLTGPPKIGSLVLPRASMSSPVTETWVDASRYAQMRSGAVVVVGDRRFRLRWTAGWTALSLEQFNGITAVLRWDTFQFWPRTAMDGESELARSYLVRCVSDVLGPGPLVRSVYALQIELESVRLVDAFGEVI